MRFTKQLTAIACATMFWGGGATAQTCDETLSATPPAGLWVGRDEQWRVQALYINPDCVEYKVGQWLSRAKYSAATGFLPKNKHAYIFELGPIGEIQDEHMGEREKIVGVTKDGTSVTLYCQLAHPCTVGSLNRHSLAWGLPFMVPKEMLDDYNIKKKL